MRIIIVVQNGAERSRGNITGLPNDLITFLNSNINMENRQKEGVIQELF